MSALSLGALERVQEVRETAYGDGTKTGVEVRLACEPNGSDGCRRENLHPLLALYHRFRLTSDPTQSLRRYRAGLAARGLHIGHGFFYSCSLP
jgi:hypothetical protein